MVDFPQEPQREGAMKGKHYVCTGTCGTVLDMPGVCKAEFCPQFGHKLAECECTDGKHGGLKAFCVNCGKLCEEGKCEIEPFKEELEA